MPWNVACQDLSMEFSRQEYWSGQPFPPPGDLPDPGVEPRSPALQADALRSEPPGEPKPLRVCVCVCVSVCMCVSHSVVSNSVTPWTVAPQVPLSKEFSRQEYWSGLPFPYPYSPIKRNKLSQL